MSCSCTCSGSCSGNCGCNCDACNCNSCAAIGAVPIPAPILPAGSVCQNACDTMPDPCCDQIHLPLEDIDIITIPEIDASIQVSVCDADQWPVGHCVVVTWDGTYSFLRVSSVDTDDNLVTLTNDGFIGTLPPGTVTMAQTQMFLWGPCPDTVDGPTDCCCLNLFVAEAFTAPGALATALMTVTDCHSMVAGMRLRVQGLGCVEIIDTPTATVIEISVRNYEAGVTGGDTVPEGGFVHPEFPCIATDDTIDGDGSDADPFTVAEVPTWATGSNAVLSAMTLENGIGNDITLPQDVANQPLLTALAPGELSMTNNRHDAFGGMDLANDWYEIPADWGGIYNLMAAVQMDENSTAGMYSLAFGRNGDELISDMGQSNEVPNTIDTDIVVNITIDVLLAAGDQISLYLVYEGAAGRARISADYESVRFFGKYVSK